MQPSTSEWHTVHDQAITMLPERNSSTVTGVHHKSVAEEPVTSVLAPGEVPILDRELNDDEEVLAALGYK